MTIVCSSVANLELFEKEHSKDRIRQALEEFSDFEILVRLASEEKKLDEIDDATDRIKKIFGDDIVVIK